MRRWAPLVMTAVFASACSISEMTTTSIAVVPPTATARPAAGVFVPANYEAGDGRLVLPVTFPDGSRAELVVPSGLDVTSHGVTPYSSGQTPGFARDFLVLYGTVDDAIAQLGGGELLAEYGRENGDPVGFWRVAADAADYLAFQFGAWAVLVYEYRFAEDGPRMTDEDRQVWASNFYGYENEEGFLVLDGQPPLQLAQAGEHAGPELVLNGASGGIDMFLNDCEPFVDDSAGQADFAAWCDVESGIQVHSFGDERLVAALKDLEIRKVVYRDLTRMPVGQPGCEPPSPVLPYLSGASTESLATSDNGEVWALLFDRTPLRHNAEVKIVWRVPDEGPFFVTAIGPNGSIVEPSFGPAFHEDSSWSRPGTEWGTAFVLPSEGCWNLRVEVGDGQTADLWIDVS